MSSKTKTTNTNRRKLPTTSDSATAAMQPKPTKVQKPDGNSAELETLKKQIEVLKKQREYDAQQIRKQNCQIQQLQDSWVKSDPYTIRKSLLLSYQAKANKTKTDEYEFWESHRSIVDFLPIDRKIKPSRSVPLGIIPYGYCKL